MSLFKSKRLGARLIFHAVILSIFLQGSAGMVMLLRSKDSTRSIIDSKGEALVNLLEKISTPYIDNFDYPSLDGFVLESVKDPDVAFLVFFDSKSKPVTKVSEEPKDISDLLVYERSDQEPGGHGDRISETGL